MKSNFTLFILVFLFMQVHFSLSPLPPAGPVNFELLVIPSAGRTASLGTMYDHARERFSSANIFRKRLGESVVTRNEKPRIETTSGLSNTLTEKAKLLGIDAEAALSLGFLIVKGTGMVNFLHETSSKWNSVKGSLVFTATTKDEGFNFFFKKARSYISLRTLRTVAGTHIVIGIDFGSHLFIEFEDKNLNNTEKSEAAAELEATINAARFNLTPNVTGESKSETIERFRKYDFTIKGDINLEDAYPTDYTQIIDLITRFPSLVNLSDGGKGAQKNFYLMPIQSFQRWVVITDSDPAPNSTEEVGTSTTPNTNSNFQSPELWRQKRKRQTTEYGQTQFPTQAMQALLFFEYVDYVERRVSDLATNLHTFREFVNESALNSSAKYSQGIVRLRRVLSKKLNKAIFNLRNDTYPLTVFEKKWDKYLLLARHVLGRTENRFQTEFRRVRLKLALIKDVSRYGTWTSKRENFFKTITRIRIGPSPATCVTRYKSDFTVDQAGKVLKNVVEGAKQNYTPIVIDCDTVANQAAAAPCTDTSTRFDDKCAVV